MKLLVLLFAHLLADYPLQGEFLAKMKGQNLLLLMTHCGIWTGCVCLAAHWLGISVPLYMLAAQFGIHMIADFAKAKGHYGKLNPLRGALWIDQGIHFGQILLLWGMR